MSTTISVRFPLGYVHATPWLRNVNEAAVEWPPSPWRLLRGLVSTWKLRCSQLAEQDVLAALRAIAEPPVVWVQPRTEASLRTYLPSDAHRSSQPKTDLMIDAFAAVDRSTPAVAYRWPAELHGGERDALAQLVGALGYLGRAESVCCASLDDPLPDAGRWLDPLPDEEGVGQRTMVTAPPLDLDSLCVAIGPMRRGGRLRPPGAQWVRYKVPAPGEDFGPAAPRPLAKPTAVRFGMWGPALPSIHATVVMSDELRRQAMLALPQAVSSTFGGKGGDGRPRSDPDRANQHAHWLPLDLDCDRLLDTAVVWAPEGLDRDEVQALAGMRRLVSPPYRDGVKDFRPVWLGVEAVGDLAAVGLGDRLVGPAASWRSVTPFAPQRHRKRENPDTFIEDCVRRELAARPHLGRDAADLLTSVEVVRGDAGAFRRHRRKESVRRQRSAFHVRLGFSRPVRGPISIGGLSHFGLGLFAVAGAAEGTSGER